MRMILKILAFFLEKSPKEYLRRQQQTNMFDISLHHNMNHSLNNTYSYMKFGIIVSEEGSSTTNLYLGGILSLTLWENGSALLDMCRGVWAWTRRRGWITPGLALDCYLAFDCLLWLLCTGGLFSCDWWGLQELDPAYSESCGIRLILDEFTLQTCASHNFHPSFVLQPTTFYAVSCAIDSHQLCLAVFTGDALWRRL